jgi:hypothetical protein
VCSSDLPSAPAVLDLTHSHAAAPAPPPHLKSQTRNAETSTSAASAAFEDAAWLERCVTRQSASAFVSRCCLSRRCSGQSASLPLPLTLSEVVTANAQALFQGVEEARAQRARFLRLLLFPCL